MTRKFSAVALRNISIRITSHDRVSEHVRHGKGMFKELASLLSAVTCQIRQMEGLLIKF